MRNRRKFIKDAALATGGIFSSKLSSAFTLTKEKLFDNTISAPFLHGIASGDPLSSQVIIWTKVSPAKEGSCSLQWEVATDEMFVHITQSGTVTTVAHENSTVKIDVQHLVPSTLYYYRFITEDTKSPVGRTKTTPLHSFENLQFAVVSCSDYSAGYYTAYRRIAERKDLNAVIHLGDYIYEGTRRDFDPQGRFSGDEYEATHFNRTKEWWLRYYRRRYALNRLDPDLQLIHQAHPFITIWDDHEIANNAWKGGAQGHNPEVDGDWEDRKSAARQAYAEWMPIRGDARKIYRSIRFGEMAEIILLDTRVEGRDKQIYDAQNAALLAPQRTILGREQKEWLFQQLKDSSCQWKVVANQVVFSEFNVGWADVGGFTSAKVKELQNTLLDYWEGYPSERDGVINHISKNKINNVVILSASMHCALAFDVTKRATRDSRKGEAATYDPVKGEGSVAVEFAATSVTSANFDERMGAFYAGTFQSLVNKKLPQPLNYNPNPHLKFADLQRHGYFILKLSKERAEVQFYFVDIKSRNGKETADGAWHTKAGRNRLERSG